jgi:Uri superfamily endonuclease
MAASEVEDRLWREIPESKGTYLLVASLAAVQRIAIGRLGAFDFIPGYYLYVGSAFGSGGLRARLQTHLAARANPHWHIDYLLRWATPLEVWFARADRKLEHEWAEWLERKPSFRMPVPRFGSSDYRRSRTSHLFFRKRRPAFGWFQQAMAEEFAADLVMGRAIFPAGLAAAPNTLLIYE